MAATALTLAKQSIGPTRDSCFINMQSHGSARDRVLTPVT
jgi:hypothetical protein